MRSFNILSDFPGKLVEMYKSQPEKFHPRLPRFLEMTNIDSWYKMLLVQLFTEVAKKEPEVSWSSDALTSKQFVVYFLIKYTII